jgi:hypothetical protein
MIPKGVIKHNLQQVSKEELKWLEENGHLKYYKGQCENIVIVSKRKRSNGKTRFVPDQVYEKLKLRK